MSRLADVDLSVRLSKKEAKEQLAAAQQRLVHLRLLLRRADRARGARSAAVRAVRGLGRLRARAGRSSGWSSELDPRHVRVAQFAAPTYDEKRHHFLWRFWPVLPGWGGMAVLDRTWYGRVLVERVEGFATEEAWQRAYEEIVDLETTLAAEGMILVKFWMHLSPEEQLRRFESRRDDPYRAWKLTDEDWRNREKRPAYEAAVEDMLERTDHPAGPWHVVAAEDKRWARVDVVRTVCEAIEAALEDARDRPDPPLDRRHLSRTPPLLVHLIEPAHVAGGADRRGGAPAVAGAVGFVHLSDARAGPPPGAGAVPGAARPACCSSSTPPG